MEEGKERAVKHKEHAVREREEWVTDKDALYTLIALNGIQPGDEVNIMGDPREAALTSQWNYATLRIEADNQCTLLSAPCGQSLRLGPYGWVNQEMQHRIVIGWRRPLKATSSS